eukprot:GHVU01218511.1.p2 GENE.GHVU01218511.1~~GHVU01218511.1.p2  ORF type:complete len:111 (+),score=33.51 GHVU01218511.1:175-507(+)
MLEEMVWDVEQKVEDKVEQESERLRMAEDKMKEMQKQQQVSEQKCDERLMEQEKARCDLEAAMRQQLRQTHEGDGGGVAKESSSGRLTLARAASASAALQIARSTLWWLE